MDKLKLRKYIKLNHPWVNFTGGKSKNDISAGLHGNVFFDAWDAMYGLRTIPVRGE